LTFFISSFLTCVKEILIFFLGVKYNQEDNFIYPLQLDFLFLFSLLEDIFYLLSVIDNLEV